MSQQGSVSISEKLNRIRALGGAVNVQVHRRLGG